MADEDKSPEQLDRARLAEIVRIEALETASYQDLENVVQNSGAELYQPDPAASQDPRSDLWISYSEARRTRPLSAGVRAQPDESPSTDETESGRDITSCIVCECRLTPVVDMAPLCKDHRTFITPNLFPMVYPFPPGRAEGNRGVHLLQWCSTLHDADLHNMCSHDLEVVFARLAALEKFLLHSEAAGFPRSAGDHSGYAAIMKNRGFKVGGSVEHGHQQIAHLSVLPRRIAEDRDFKAKEGAAFADHLRAAARPDLVVAEFPGGVSALISPFMRRPLEAVIVPPRGAGEYLHHLDHDVLKGLATAMREMTGALNLLMEQRNLSFDYNLAFHTGPVGLLYVEILPYTQPYGGFEHLGHYLCQDSPQATARVYRDVLGYR